MDSRLEQIMNGFDSTCSSKIFEIYLLSKTFGRIINTNTANIRRKYDEEPVELSHMLSSGMMRGSK